jgi:hypothetical protein
MTRVAILDDYQGVALELADWRSLGPGVSVHSFRERLSGEDTLSALGSRTPAETEAAGDDRHA